MALSSGSTPPLTPHLTPSPNISSTLHIGSPYSRESTPELTPEQERARRRAIVQPAFFYPNSGTFDPLRDTPQHLAEQAELPPDADALADELLDPAEDPRATRGIPVFRPTVQEFADFEGYMERIEPWGRRSGIVKVIPPKEWTAGLSSTAPRLSGIKLKNPIEQHMIGRTGLYRQQNEERRHTYSVRDWAGLCSRDGLRAPAPREIVQQELNARRSKRARKGEDTVEDEEERAALVDALRTLDERQPNTRKPDPTPAAHTDSDFYNTFEPSNAWLPKDTIPEDYTPAVCRALERHFWRNCGLGKDPMYGADMQGTLFDPEMKTWNVASLPNVLERLLPEGNKIPGVNTPYLYFGMWRATFAWHVEDMDLYSINYIHWGAPKYWYAIPSERSHSFEDTMRKHFSTEATECPQFMRHKSFLASPAILAEANCRPNTLVQHQGEFVITYPRGYHAGFNVGLNCAESVNFALESWIDIGRKAQYCKCVGDSVHLDVDSILAEREARDALDLAINGYANTLLSNEKRKEPPTHDPSPKRARHHESGVAYATAAQLERLPTIKIKIKPPQKSTTSPYRARTQLVTQGLPKLASPTIPRTNRPTPSPPKSAHPSGSLPRLKIPPQSALPCALCSAVDLDGLLPLWESSSENSSRSRPQAVASPRHDRVHEACAQAIPETWVSLINGCKYVCGVGQIVKDRWALKCSVCTNTPTRAHGAKIQCAKGRCPKAFHVTCARDHPDVEFMSADDFKASNEPGRLKKPRVTALCPQHNPRLIEARKADKIQKLDADIGALTQFSRIKVRASGGVFAVTLVNVYEDRRTVEVMWDQGGTKEFRYSSVVWGDEGEVVEKPGRNENDSNPAPVASSSLQKNDPPVTSKDPQQPAPVGSSNSAPTNPAPGYNYVAQHFYYTYTPAYHNTLPAEIPQANHPSQPVQSQAAYNSPIPYPYPYGYPTQPHYYPAHGYHYPPIAAYQPPAPTSAAPAPISGSSTPNSVPTGGSGSRSVSTGATQSYVGVRPVSSQDILSGAHQARARV